MSGKNDADLAEAVSKGNLELVRAAIKDGANVDCMLEIDQNEPLLRSFWSSVKEIYLTVLFLAVKNGDAAITRELIQSGANVNRKGPASGVCPIHVAARKGDIGVLRELISGGADVNIRDDGGYAAIHSATDGGDVGVLKALIAAGADINAKSKSGATAMWWAAVKSQERKLDEFIPELIHHGAVIDTGCDDGGSALLLMSKFDHEKMYIKVITEMIRCWDLLCGSDKNALTGRLMELISNEDILVMFNDKSYQDILNISDESGRTIMQKIVGLGQNTEVMKRLLSYGVNVSSVDSLGQTLLHSAMPIGYVETTQCLIDAGCDYTALDGFGRSVLHLAAFYGHSKQIELLLSRGLKPNYLDNCGRNCLHYAIIGRQDEAVRILCHAGANRSEKDVNDMAPGDFMHPCEEACLPAQQLRGDILLPLLTFEEDNEFHLEITNTPSLESISNIPGIGSVNHIQGFDMSEFLKNVRDEIFAFVCKELPGLLNTKAIELIGCGSSAEGSKVGIPNEVDFLIISEDVFPFGSDNKDEGYCDLQSLWCTVRGFPISGSYSVWLWNLLMAKWNEHHQQKRQDLGGKFQIPFPPVRHPEHSTCVNWIWLYSDDVFTMLPVSIDLVMAFKHDSEWQLKTISVATWLKNKGDKVSSYKVPKIPEESYRKTHFEVEGFNCVGRVSYPPLEVEHLVSLEDRVKVVYITAKCLRMPEVCRFKIRDDNGSLHISSDYVTSYHLKTVFLDLAELFMKSNLSLGRMVLMVYRQLEHRLSWKRLPMFFDKKVNVLAGSKLKISESLKVARVMTKFVRMLYFRDFSSVLDKDAEEERRIRRLMPACLAWNFEEDDSMPPRKKPKLE